ncbi:MAG: LysR family transcriptional regulator [Verrucomicrobiales bacterium]
MNGTPDFNLLITLDVLLSECSVVRAAKRLRLSPSAMSRALARLRHTMGDPILVRAGRKLVPTTRAQDIQEQVKQLVQEIHTLLRTGEELELKQLTRAFTLRTSDGFVENFGPDLITRIQSEAPYVQLRFEQKPIKDNSPLREGLVDLEIGVIEETTDPEIRTRLLYMDRFVGVVRKGHPLSHGNITPARYASGNHISVSRSATGKGMVDAALEELGLGRRVVSIIPGFSAALALAQFSDLIATVPERHTKRLRSEMFTFPLPITTPSIKVSMLWHPRLDADAAHHWLRECVRATCAVATL